MLERPRDALEKNLRDYLGIFPIYTVLLQIKKCCKSLIFWIKNWLVLIFPLFATRLVLIFPFFATMAVPRLSVDRVNTKSQWSIQRSSCWATNYNPTQPAREGLDEDEDGVG